VQLPCWSTGILRLLFGCLVLASLLSVPTFSQQFTRNEFTVGTSFQTYGFGPYLSQSGKISTDHVLSYSTPSFTFTHNLSPSLALEGTFQPSSAFQNTDAQEAGRETLAMGGVKTGWRGQRWGFYGKVQAGVASFSCSFWTFDPNAYSDCKRQSNFALEYGGVVEYRLSARYAIRVDAGQLVMTRFDQILQRYSDGLPESFFPGAISQHLAARIGITRSFGSLQEAKQERVPGRQTRDAGVVFALQPRILPSFGFLDSYPEWGLWASWNFSKHVSWDTTLLHSPRNAGTIEDIDYQAGGRAFEALTGVKIGIRRDHMGYFAKVRPGTITFGETERQLVELPNANGSSITACLPILCWIQAVCMKSTLRAIRSCVSTPVAQESSTSPRPPFPLDKNSPFRKRHSRLC